MQKIINSFIIVGILFGIVLTLGFFNQIFNPFSSTSYPSLDSPESDALPQISVNFNIVKFNETSFTNDEFLVNIRSGGVGKDGIPPIENPVYLEGIDADKFLSDSDIVFGLDFGGELLAFPQFILVWHEIVNEEIDNVKISLTYCPLTGSAVGYIGHFLRIETTFGVSGNLLNSNLVMYDRDSDSYWPQILGRSINGDHEDISLEKIQLFWTTWGNWYNIHPNTKVLSEETGHIRNYGSDPYGDYNSESSYYTSGNPWFPIMAKNSTLSPKSVVYGFSFEKNHVAVEKSLLLINRVINLNISNQTFVLFYDEDLETARVYKSILEGRKYIFNYTDKSFKDLNTNTKWNVNGTSTLGTLEPVVYFDVMWFAWFGFHPETTLVFK